MQKVTIYTTGGFGNIVAIEAKLESHGTVQYAQYPNAVQVKFIKKGCRKTSGFIQSYNPNLLIVSGWNNPKPEDMNNAAVTCPKTGLQTSRSRYTSFDSRYQSDFDATIDASDVEIIADYRGHNSKA